MKLKIILVVFSIFLPLFSVCSAAEHKVKYGEVIGTISEEIGCSVLDLAQLNGIASPKYIIREGDVLKYISEQDLQNARKWAMEYLESHSPVDYDYLDIQRVVADIDAGTIEYGSGNIDTHASEIIILADTYRSR